MNKLLWKNSSYKIFLILKPIIFFPANFFTLLIKMYLSILSLFPLTSTNIFHCAIPQTNFLVGTFVTASYSKTALDVAMKHTEDRSIYNIVLPHKIQYYGFGLKLAKQERN